MATAESFLQVQPQKASPPAQSKPHFCLFPRRAVGVKKRTPAFFTTLVCRRNISSSPFFFAQIQIVVNQGLPSLITNAWRNARRKRSTALEPGLGLARVATWAAVGAREGDDRLKMPRLSARGSGQVMVRGVWARSVWRSESRRRAAAECLVPAATSIPLSGSSESSRYVNSSETADAAPKRRLARRVS
jgi:hypothetical protein